MEEMDDLTFEKLVDENTVEVLTDEDLAEVSGGVMGMKNGQPFGVYATWPVPPDEMYQRARRAKGEGQTMRQFFRTYVHLNQGNAYPNLWQWLRAQWPCMTWP